MKLSIASKDALKQLIAACEAEVMMYKDIPEKAHEYKIALELIEFLKTGLDTDSN